MIVTLAFLAVVASVVIWWLLPQRITSKPWLEQGAIEDVHSERIGSIPTAKLGLWVFLAVVTSVFALLVSAYSIRMEYSDWQPLPDPTFLWLNTGILIISSITFQRARAAARNDSIYGVKSGLILAGLFTFAFLIGQLWVWQQLNESGYFVASNPANSFFYLLTALHGLHLLGGLWVWGKTASRVWAGTDVSEVRLSVDLCTVYWHFLLLVWLALFGLLLST